MLECWKSGRKKTNRLNRVQNEYLLRYSICPADEKIPPVMKSKKNTLDDWQLARERFRISNRFPPRPKRPERKIGAILAEIQGEKSEVNVLPEVLKDRWVVVAGEQIAQHTHPAILRGTQLVVFADHPGWLSEIRRLPTQHLLKKIASIPKAPEIKEIRFQLDPSIRTYRN